MTGTIPTVKTSKAALGDANKDPAERDLEKVAEIVKQCYDSQDDKEGCAAFMEKRRPDFIGK